jgi:hypothetical protein
MNHTTRYTLVKQAYSGYNPYMPGSSYTIAQQGRRPDPRRMGYEGWMERLRRHNPGIDLVFAAGKLEDASNTYWEFERYVAQEAGVPGIETQIQELETRIEGTGNQAEAKYLRDQIEKLKSYGDQLKGQYLIQNPEILKDYKDVLNAAQQAQAEQDSALASHYGISVEELSNKREELKSQGSQEGLNELYAPINEAYASTASRIGGDREYSPADIYRGWHNKDMLGRLIPREYSEEELAAIRAEPGREQYDPSKSPTRKTTFENLQQNLYANKTPGLANMLRMEGSDASGFRGHADWASDWMNRNPVTNFLGWGYGHEGSQGKMMQEVYGDQGSSLYTPELAEAGLNKRKNALIGTGLNALGTVGGGPILQGTFKGVGNVASKFAPKLAPQVMRYTQPISKVVGSHRVRQADDLINMYVPLGFGAAQTGATAALGPEHWLSQGIGSAWNAVPEIPALGGVGNYRHGRQLWKGHGLGPNAKGPQSWLGRKAQQLGAGAQFGQAAYDFGGGSTNKLYNWTSPTPSEDLQKFNIKPHEKLPYPSY